MSVVTPDQINGMIDAGQDLGIVLGRPKVDFRLKSAGVVEQYLKWYDAYNQYRQQQLLQRQVYGIQDSFAGLGLDQQFEYGSLNPFNFIDANYVIHPRELERIDREVGMVQRVMAIAPKLFTTKDIGRGSNKYIDYYNQDPLDPILTKNFKTYEPGKEAMTEKAHYFIGAHKDYEFGMFEMDASRKPYLNDDIMTRTVREFTALVADFKERILWRGGDIKSNNNKNIDDRVYGFVTHDDILDQTTVTDVTTVGEGVNMITEMADLLMADGIYKPPFPVIMTPKLYTRLMKNRNEYSDWTDLKNIMELGKEDNNPIVSGIYVTPHLLNVAQASDNAVCLMFKPTDQAGRPNGFIAESYPLWHYPMVLSTQLGNSGKVAWMGGAVIRRPDAFVKTTGITIA